MCVCFQKKQAQALPSQCSSPCSNKGALAPPLLSFFLVVGVSKVSLPTIFSMSPFYFYFFMCFCFQRRRAWALPSWCSSFSRYSGTSTPFFLVVDVSKQRSFAPHHWWAPPPPPCFYVCLFIKEEGASVTITVFSIMQQWRSFNSFFFFFFFGCGCKQAKEQNFSPLWCSSLCNIFFSLVVDVNE